MTRTPFAVTHGKKLWPILPASLFVHPLREDAIKSALHIQEKRAGAPKIPSNAFMPAKRAKNLTLQKRRQWVLYL
jgi:hypothetical protein